MRSLGRKIKEKDGFTVEELAVLAEIFDRYAGTGPPCNECFQPTKHGIEWQNKKIGRIPIQTFTCTTFWCDKFEKVVDRWNMGELLA